MNNSPMFKHAIESFEHGLEHFLDNSAKSRKFALLHIDQAIELLLKERTVQIGKSIYKKDGSTLNLHEIFNSLKSIDIPERPRLEELHDLRNTVQHKGLTPDSESTKYYVEIAYGFFENFLRNEMNTTIDQVLPETYRAFMKGQASIDTSEVLSILNGASQAGTPSEKILVGFTALNRLVDLLSNSPKAKVQFRKTLKTAAASRGKKYSDLKPYLATIMRLRNEIIHSDYSPSEDDVDIFFRALEGVFELVGFEWS